MKHIYHLIGAFVFVLLASVDIQAQYKDGLMWFSEAEQCRQKAQYSQALLNYNNAVKREPENFRYIFGKAQCEYKLKKIELAVSSLKRVIHLNSTYSPAYALLARIYSENKTMEDAAENAAKLYDIASRYEKDVQTSMGYRFQVIRYLIQAKDFTRAHQKIAAAKFIDQYNPELALLDAKVSNVLGKHEAAISAVTTIEHKIVSLHQSENAPYYFELGYALYQKEQYEQAFKAFDKANYGNFKAKIELFCPAYLSKIALAYNEVMEYEESKKYLDKIQKINSQDATSLYLLAEMERKNKDQSKAIDLYLQAVRVEKDYQRSMAMYEKITELQLEMGLYAEAAKTCEQGLSLNAKHPLLLYNKAVAHYKQAQYGDVIANLSTYVHIAYDPLQTSRAFFLMGLAASKNNDLKAARNYFSQCNTAHFHVAATHEMKKINHTTDDIHAF